MSSGKDPSKTGREWLDIFLKAQGTVGFNALWAAFAIGQAAAAMEFGDDPEITRQMLDQFDIDIDDLEKAAAELILVCRDLLANARRNNETP